MDALWTPSEERVSQSQLSRFQQAFANQINQPLLEYKDLHKASIEQMEEFWVFLMNYFEVVGEGNRLPACLDKGFDHYGWFPNYRLNFAENLLSKGKDNDCAIDFIHESGRQRQISYSELKEITARLQGALSYEVTSGDVVACYMPNIPETVITMLATTALGGVFTSTSCDFGIEGVLDRFGQSKPKILVTVNAYQYNGKTHSMIPKLKAIADQLQCLEKIVVVDFLGEATDWDALGSDKFIAWEDYLSHQIALSFERQPFSHPLYIMYSSGTTGKPKCIVHSVGGTLLKHLCELGLHTNLTADKSIMYFTTCGWMMWNWLVSSLACGARMVLYEGSPGYPSLKEFYELIDRHQINIFGTSPKFLKALQDSGYECERTMPSLETILSTGAPLLPEQFEYIYSHLKTDVCVSSIAGGTDIIGCFMLGNPNLPVYASEIQCLGLGMDIAAYNPEGVAMIEQEGELVCRQSFPSRPIYFLNDPTNEKLKEAYFDVYPGVWTHGDFVKITERGGVVIYGRSDATLNPGGVRIGTAEIYRQTELLDWIEDSLCVGRPVDGDVEVVLFVKLQSNEILTDGRIKEIKSLIKSNTTPRHVPKNIWAVSDIPYTRSGKKMELAISRILAKRQLQNLEAVANPGCLSEYEQYQ